MKLNTQIFAFLFGIIHVCVAQKSCNFTETIETSTPSFIQHFSTSKCLKIASTGSLLSAKVILDDCSYRNKISENQKLILSNSSVGKMLIKNKSDQAETSCLSIKNNTLVNDFCQSMNSDQNWSFKPVRNSKGQFTIEQYSTKKCLIPKSRSTGSVIELKPCNSLHTEQIWKICI